MTLTHRPPGYIATLDGWRAIAVLLVIGAHCSWMLHASGTLLGSAAARFFAHAGYGVDVFFAISGFLIVTLLLREKDATGALDLKGFYVRRSFRILPPMLVYLAVVSLLGAFNTLPVESSDVMPALFFYRNYVEGSWYTAHYWSLAIEEHFYLAVPIVVGLLSKRQALTALVGAALACIVIRALEAAFLEGVKVEFRTESRFDALMWGSIAAVVAATSKGRAWLTRHLTPLTVLVIIGVAVPLLVSVHYMPARRTIVALVVPTVVLFTLLRPQGWVGRALEISWLRWIGRLSYSLYIWQMLFLVPIVHLPIVQSFPGALVATILCAVASYYWIEQPAIAAGRAWARRRKSERAAAPSTA